MSEETCFIKVPCLQIYNEDQYRFQQIYSDGSKQNEFCVHGLPYRKWCDECEEIAESFKDSF